MQYDIDEPHILERGYFREAPSRALEALERPWGLGKKRPRLSGFPFRRLELGCPVHHNNFALHDTFEVDLATKFAQEGFGQEDPEPVFFAIASGFIVSFARVGDSGKSAFADCRDFAGVGLPGEALLTVIEELTELEESFVFVLACENMECVELTSVLELLPGSLFMAGRMGVEGLIGSGKPLVRRWILALDFPLLPFFGSGGGALPLE